MTARMLPRNEGDAAASPAVASLFRELERLVTHFPHLGMDLDLGSMSIDEMHGLRQRLHRLEEEDREQTQ